ncbi:lipoate--protein ligase family protein [Nocardioides sp.]|uniref:lipoate--protein ligase family protein n=1 Tax=Nocardioides sp. TaxID=35761 RepID=UPI003D0E9F3D
MSDPIRLLRSPLTDSEPALDIAVAHALVKQASAGSLTEALRLYRPSSPVVVFGRRDVRLDGFPGAVDAVRAAGFTPLVRATGGRAVAYTDQSLVLDHVRHDAGAQGGMDPRFETYGRLFAEAFRGLGVQALVGPVPGEYCPGAHSVNARGVVKLVGTAQRVVRHAWLFSSLVVIGDQDRIRPVLSEVYEQLGQDFDGSSVGSLRGEVPGLELTQVESALLAAYAELGVLEPAVLDESTLVLARELVDQHRVGDQTRS